MTELQLTEIRNYLLSKKLPIDILIEVNDHFVSQISDLQKDENLSFDEAFEKTKLSWDKELKPYYHGDWDLEDRSKLLRTINRNNFYSLAKKSIIYTFIIIASLAILSQTINFEVYKYIFVLIIGLILCIPLINYFKNKKDLSLSKKYTKHILISIQEYTMFSIRGIYFYFKFLIDGFEVAKMFKDFMSVQNFDNFLFGTLIAFALLFVSFLSIFSQKIYLSKIQKVKPFLKCL
jgi:hypothetical protein